MQTSMHSCFGVVILIGLIAVLSVPQPAIAQLAWDLADDFSISNGNPHDVNGATWDYQYRTSTSASPTTFAGTRVNNRAPGGGGTKWDLPPNEAWVRNASGAEDAISLNKFSADAGPNDLTSTKRVKLVATRQQGPNGSPRRMETTRLNSADSMQEENRSVGTRSCESFDLTIAKEAGPLMKLITTVAKMLWKYVKCYQ